MKIKSPDGLMAPPLRRIEDNGNTSTQPSFAADFALLKEKVLIFYIPYAIIPLHFVYARDMDGCFYQLPLTVDYKRVTRFLFSGG